MHITELLRECLLHLFSFLDRDSRKCLSQTCRSLKDVYHDPLLWPLLSFSSLAEINKKNYVLGPALRSLSICWYSSRVKICNIENWEKSSLQKSMCSQHLNIASNLLLQVSERCPNLRSLTLSGCAHVSDEEIIQILASCPRLQSLKLENCSGVTDKMLAVIPLLGGHLQTLHVNFCRNITQDGLIRVLVGCPALDLQAIRSAEMIADRLPEPNVTLHKNIRKLILQ
ncbi:F-box and leucine-rich protein 22 [Bombina bombina]|uniref:F-box and leucine-rich protein 22 n=1 Tax=Bombina bombina TaxID=8345 RepID=UPI00235B2992|nr:F-box and leucine-rich protein 22 [Bombina bombina]